MHARHAARRIGRATGVASGTVALALWLLFLRRVVAAGDGSGLVAAAMIALAATAIGAALSERPMLLLACFALSFLPVGLYLIATPSIFAGIGLANVLYLVAGLLIWGARRDATVER